MKSFTIVANSIVTLTALIQLCAATPIELSGQLRVRQAAQSGATSIDFQPTGIPVIPVVPSAAQTTGAYPTFAEPLPVPSSQPTAASSPSTTYTIQAGDTFSYIAAKFGTSVSALEVANSGLTPNNLQIGTLILIPRNFAARSVASVHIIQAGDTFSSVATQLGISVAALESANPSLNPTDLQIGDEIVIPGNVTATGPNLVIPVVNITSREDGKAVEGQAQSTEQGITFLSTIFGRFISKSQQ
jgi:LysM repeat protein